MKHVTLNQMVNVWVWILAASVVDPVFLVLFDDFAIICFAVLSDFLGSWLILAL